MPEFYKWQMVKLAVEHLNGKATNKQIFDYIISRWPGQNIKTLRATIIMLTVNHESRIHYPENLKARLTISGSNYDYLFRTNRGKVIKYNSNLHGVWEIYLNEGNSPKVRMFVEPIESIVYTPNDILWIKNVTNSTNGETYLTSTEQSFVLHFPTHHKGNVLKPAINDLILIYQRVHGLKSFTHLVTPIDNELLEDGERPEFRYGRRVKTIAKTRLNTVIPVTSTLWNRLNFQGFTQGNACRIENISNIGNSDELRLDIWQKFNGYFTSAGQQSFVTTSSLLNELDISNPDLTVTEGELKLVAHLVRERNRKIVGEKKQQAIKNNKLQCEACKFSFPRIYNASFIECHHIIPISTPGRSKETRLEDLVLVCSNCHRMLHTKFDGQYLTIEQLSNRMIALASTD